MIQHLSPAQHSLLFHGQEHFRFYKLPPHALITKLFCENFVLMTSAILTNVCVTIVKSSYFICERNVMCVAEVQKDARKGKRSNAKNTWVGHASYGV